MQPLRKNIPTHSVLGVKCRSMSEFKPHLRLDFGERCAYCGDGDSIAGSTRNFQVDHFAPKSKFPDLEFEYGNLMYACPYCNRAKWDYWVGEDAKVCVDGDKGIVNPCTPEYDEHLGRLESGAIVAKTPLGWFMYNRLKLYLRRHHLFYKLERLKERIDVLRHCGKCEELVYLYDALTTYYQLSNTIDNREGVRIARQDVPPG